MLALRNVTTIDNNVVKNYQDRMRVAGTTLTFEQAVVACLKAKHDLHGDFSRNKPLEGVKLSSCMLTQELIDGFKQWGSGIKELKLDTVNLPNGQPTGFVELLSQMSGLKELRIKNSDFNERLDLSTTPKLTTLVLNKCALLQHLPIVPRGSMLESLFIAGCNAITHPPDLTYAKQLKALFLQNLQGLQTAPAIAEGSMLQRIYIEDCPAIINPPDLAHAKQLKILKLDGVQALQTAPVIPEGSVLEELYIVECPAITNPPDMTHAAHLRVLTLLSCTGLRTALVLPRVNVLQSVRMIDCPIKWPIGWEQLPDGVLKN